MKDDEVDETQFLHEMERIDIELTKKGVPVHARFLHAFPLLDPDYRGPLFGIGAEPENYPPFIGPSLLKSIDEWYQERYGERALLSTTIGKIPIVIRKQIYLIRVPLAYGAFKLPVFSLIYGLTESMLHSLTAQQKESIWAIYKEGYDLTYEIKILEDYLAKDNNPLSNSARQMIFAALGDLDTAIKCLSDDPDTNGACFHAQQHAEKFLKSFLISKNAYSETQLRFKPFGHNLEKIFEACLAVSSEFNWVTTEIALLKNITMDVRYSAPKIEPESAVESFCAALRIGGLTASQIVGVERRYRLIDRDPEVFYGRFKNPLWDSS